HVVSHAMEFLRPNHKIEMWDFFQQLRAPCLRHAAEKSKDGFRPALYHAAEHSHFAQRLLLGHVAHATGIEQHNIGLRLATDPLVAAGNERMRDLLGIALVHLATVGLDEKSRHGSRTIHRGRHKRYAIRAEWRTVKEMGSPSNDGALLRRPTGRRPL